MRIIALCNQKGGVGKTTTAVNLGVALKLLGKKVLLIDFDPQANLSSYLGFEGDDSPTMTDLLLGGVMPNTQKIDPKDTIRHNKENDLDFIPSDIQLSYAEVYLIQAMSREKCLLNRLSADVFKQYDYILVDCLPSLGVLVTNALTASDNLLIPVQTQKFALDGLTMLNNVYEQVKNNLNNKLDLIGVLPTMVDETNMSKTIISALTERYGDKMFNTHISRSVKAAESSEKMIALPLTKHKLGDEYKSLAKEVVERCEK